MTLAPSILDPATLAGYVVVLAGWAWLCVRFAAAGATDLRWWADVERRDVEDRARWEAGRATFAAGLAGSRAALAVLARERAVFATFREVLRSRRRAGVERARTLPDVLDAITLPTLAPVVLVLDVEDDALPPPPHRLTGSLDRNAPPAALVGVCATRAKRNARHADNRRREHSAAP